MLWVQNVSPTEERLPLLIEIILARCVLFFSHELDNTIDLYHRLKSTVFLLERRLIYASVSD